MEHDWTHGVGSGDTLLFWESARGTGGGPTGGWLSFLVWVGGFDTNALAQLTNFVGVGSISSFFIVWVLTEFTVFKRFTGGMIKYWDCKSRIFIIVVLIIS